MGQTASLDARLINRLGLRSDVRRVPMFGLGCVAGAVGIARAADYLRGHADHVALMARMMEGLPADSPPKLVMSILPRLRQQNDEIIALLREQNELLKRKRPAAAIHDSGGPE